MMGVQAVHQAYQQITVGNKIDEWKSAIVELERRTQILSVDTTRRNLAEDETQLSLFNCGRRLSSPNRPEQEERYAGEVGNT